MIVVIGKNSSGNNRSTHPERFRVLLQNHGLPSDYICYYLTKNGAIGSDIYWQNLEKLSPKTRREAIRLVKNSYKNVKRLKEGYDGEEACTCS